MSPEFCSSFLLKSETGFSWRGRHDLLDSDRFILLEEDTVSWTSGISLLPCKVTDQHYQVYVLALIWVVIIKYIFDILSLTSLVFKVTQGRRSHQTNPAEARRLRCF